MADSLMKGLYTAIQIVPDLEAGIRWYANAFGIEPYFSAPSYVGFNIRGFELGLMPAVEGTVAGPGGTLAYWGVDDAKEAYTRLLGLGARARNELEDVGEGILIGDLLDPWGNVLGIIENPNFTR